MPQNTEAADDDALTDHHEAMASEPIVEVFSSPANVQILVALVDAGGNDLPASDIMENAGITHQTWYNNYETLIEHGLIEPTRKVGNAQMFRARMQTEPVQGFIHLYDALGEEVGADEE